MIDGVEWRSIKIKMIGHWIQYRTVFYCSLNESKSYFDKGKKKTKQESVQYTTSYWTNRRHKKQLVSLRLEKSKMQCGHHSLVIDYSIISLSDNVDNQ